MRSIKSGFREQDKPIGEGNELPVYETMSRLIMLNCGDSQSRAVTKIFLNRGILFEIFLDGEVVQGTQLTDSMGAFFGIECGV